MWVIQHKGMSITDTASTSEAGAWNALFRTFPTLIKKSKKELKTFYHYEAKKTTPHSKVKKEYND